MCCLQPYEPASQHWQRKILFVSAIYNFTCVCVTETQNLMALATSICGRVPYNALQLILVV